MPKQLINPRVPRKLNFTMVCIVLAVAFATGCKRESSVGPLNSSQPPANPPAYFQTSFQEESQFIVEAIVSDLAEQMYYAASHQLPDPKVFQVTATEKPGSPRDEPAYELQIRLDAKQGAINQEINVHGPIWSPAVYRDV